MVKLTTFYWKVAILVIYGLPVPVHPFVAVDTV